jgi:hypothetical protein
LKAYVKSYVDITIAAVVTLLFCPIVHASLPLAPEAWRLSADGKHTITLVGESHLATPFENVPQRVQALREMARNHTWLGEEAIKDRENAIPLGDSCPDAAAFAAAPQVREAYAAWHKVVKPEPGLDGMLHIWAPQLIATDGSAIADSILKYRKLSPDWEKVYAGRKSIANHVFATNPSAVRQLETVVRFTAGATSNAV